MLFHFIFIIFFVIVITYVYKYNLIFYKIYKIICAADDTLSEFQNSKFDLFVA